MSNLNGSGDPRAARHTSRSRRTVAALGTIALVAFGVSLSAGAASASSAGADGSASNTVSAATAKGGVVHYVRSHGHTVRVVTNGRFGVVSQHGVKKHSAPQAPAQGGLIYNGGPVEHNPTVYLVFWGNQWDSDSNGVQSYLQGYFGGLGGSGDNWSTITTQYPDNVGAPTFNGSVLGGTWVDDAAPAPSNAAQADIAAEAQAGASHFGVSGPDADVFVVSPSGTSPDGFPNSGFCAWHDWNGTTAYTNMPYVLDAGSGCGANSVQNQLDGFSIVGGHEYAEAITDPEPASGWVDSSGSEIGDLCAWQGLTTLSLSTGSYAIQPLWSNNAGGCVASG